MEANGKWPLKDGREFIKYFPRAELNNTTIKKSALLEDTMQVIPKVVAKYAHQTVLIADYLKKETDYETAKTIWYWIKDHIAYKKDKEGTEQLRTPARTFHDRKNGVDCDCYSIFICCLLNNLGIGHTLRIAKYGKPEYQHIYPLIPLKGGGHITMDCVVDAFNYEVPNTGQKDYPMELQILSGLDELENRDSTGEAAGMEDLGRVLQKIAAKKKTGAAPAKTTNALRAVLKKNKTAAVLPMPANAAGPVAALAPRVATAAAAPVPEQKKKKGVFINKINKINPATVALRNGILASMKLNIRNMAGRLRWSYLSPQQAAARNIDMQRFQQVVRAREKLESIFYKAGGKPENLKKAILSGKGNKDQAVNGLGAVYEPAPRLRVDSDLKAALGVELYHSENVEGMEGFSGFGALGEPLTLASIAAASGIVASIAGMLKEAGNIFKNKGEKGAEDFDEAANKAAEDAADKLPLNTPPVTANPDAAGSPPEPKTEVQAASPPPDMPPDFAKESQGVTQAVNDLLKQATENKNEGPPLDITRTNGSKNTPDKEPGFWEKNKSWLKPVAIGAAVVTAAGLLFVMARGKPQNKASPATPALAGVPGRRKNHRRSTGKKKYPKLKELPIS
jgi:hypothetical protein